jgi:hypothetical protein
MQWHPPSLVLRSTSMRKKSLAAFAAAAALAAGMLMAGPASANEGGTTEGCTPGFWKNHTDWKSYDDNQNVTADDNSPSTSLAHMLRAPTGNGTDYTFPSVYGPGFGDTTMLAALSLKGGSTLNGAAQILMRAATAAYINADAALAFPYRRYTDSFPGYGGPLVYQVRDALDSQDRGTILTLATSLDAANNLGCPLS